MGFWYWFLIIIFGLIFLGSILFGIGYLIYSYSKKRLERRYKVENDRGRPTEEQRRRPNNEPIQPSRMGQPSDIQQLPTSTVKSIEPIFKPISPELEGSNAILERFKKAFRKTI